MGGSTSKRQETRDGCNTSLLRSASVPTSRNRMQEENSNKESWKSRLLSMPQSFDRGKSIKCDGVMSNLKPVMEEEVALDFEPHPGGPEIDEFVSKFDREMQFGSPVAFHSENGRLLNRCMTFQPAAESEYQCRLDASHQKPREGGVECVMSGYTPLSNIPSSRDLMDQSLGLRLLLNPPSSSFQSLVSPSRGAHPPEKTLSTKGSFNSRCSNEFTERVFARVCTDDASPLEPQWVTAPSTLSETNLPLFDPSILATVEKAVEDMAGGAWQSLPTIASGNTFLCSERCDDAVRPNFLKDSGHTLSRLKSSKSRSAREDRCDGSLRQLRTFSFLNRKPSFSKVFSLKNDKCNWSSQAYLDKFVRMCPPGCEGKVVLYFTSLRGVRKTFENCFMLRLILKGFRVHVDERDVWMHSKFRQELTDAMGMALSVPRLFILGRYIGGADEVELLHEEGILSKLLEGLPTECKQVCNVCADVRFIPCTACSGSCKIVISNDVAERCSKCNENGLIMCPMCD